MASAFGFRNIKPNTRAERRSLKDKVSLEKNRINQRVGISARMHQANAPDTSAGLITCVPDGAGYISNVDRFHSDTAGEERANRIQKYQQKQKSMEFHRDEVQRRDQSRFLQQEESTRKEEEYWKNLREEGTKSKKNQSLIAYDPITLQYHQDVNGEMQKYEDDKVKYRSQLRARALVEFGDSRASYNIINGSSRTLPEIPSPVTKPQGFGGR